jgi:hypothetical protein
MKDLIQDEPDNEANHQVAQDEHIQYIYELGLLWYVCDISEAEQG